MNSRSNALSLQAMSNHLPQVDRFGCVDGVRLLVAVVGLAELNSVRIVDVVHGIQAEREAMK